MPDYDSAKIRRDAEAAKECGLRMLGIETDVAISLFERLERAEEEVSDYQRACMGKTPETLIEKHAKEREELKSRLDLAEAALRDIAGGLGDTIPLPDIMAMDAETFRHEMWKWCQSVARAALSKGGE